MNKYTTKMNKYTNERGVVRYFKIDNDYYIFLQDLVCLNFKSKYFGFICTLKMLKNILVITKNDKGWVDKELINTIKINDAFEVAKFYKMDTTLLDEFVKTL